MSKAHDSFKKKFPGDIETAEQFIRELKAIRSSINRLDLLTIENMPKEEAKAIRMSLASSFAELVAEIEVPITIKFPSLKQDLY